MADLKKTQAQWDRFLGRELAGMFLACVYELRELELRFSSQRTRVLVLGDRHQNAAPGGMVLQGVDLGRNTSPRGFLFVRIAGTQDPRTIGLYTAPGGAQADLVAEGVGDPGQRIPLRAQQGSGLSGSWPLARLATEDLTDELRLYPVPDWALRVRQVWDGGEPKDVRSQDVFLGALEVVASRITDARRVMVQALAEFAVGQASRGAEFLEVAETALVSDTALRGGSGSVGRRRVGFFPSLARAMQDETVAGPQSVTERLVEASPGVFDPGNAGRGRVAAHQPHEFCPAARWTFSCVRGQDTGHGGAEEFRCQVRVLGEDRAFQFAGVRVKQSFSGPEGIGPFVLERVYTKQGDPTDEQLADVVQVQTAGERWSNTEAGLLYWRIGRRGFGFDVAFYRSAGRATGDLVAQAEAVPAQGGFQANERNASGLSVVWALGSQPTDGAEGRLNCNFFRVENARGVSDQFVIETRVRSEGQIQRLLASEFGARLHSRPQGQQTIHDHHVARGSLVSLLEELP